MGLFTGKKILIISPEPWGTSFISKHHYARTLADMGNEIWFLEPPHHRSVQEVDGIHIVQDTYLVRGLRFLPITVQKIFLRRSALKLQKALGVKFDVIWSFDNSRHYDLKAFDVQYRIHHVVDIGMNFHLTECAQSSDLALASNYSVLSNLEKRQPNSHFLHHGFAPFQLQTTENSKVDGKIKATYSGNLLIAYIDWVLVTALVKENSGVDFHFVGSVEGGNMNFTDSTNALKSIEELKKMENVHFEGEKSPEQMQSILSASDILLLFYDHHRFPKQVENPHKVMSYLGTGKVILSNPMRIYEGTGLIEMEDSHENYLSKFAHICNNLEFYNSPEKKNSRISFAVEHSYKNQVERISNLILKTVKND